MNGLNERGRLSKMGHMIKALSFAVLVVAISGCHLREGNPYNVRSFPHQWVLPGPGTDDKVFGPMAHEEIRDFVLEMADEGWRVMGVEPASLPEDIMISSIEMDAPTRLNPINNRYEYSRDLPKKVDGRLDAPPLKTDAATGEQVDSIPEYVTETIPNHRQKYIVIMTRWK